MTIIIDGRKLADAKLEKISSEIKKNERRPGLAIILAGDNEASKIYVRNKLRTSEKIGINAKLMELPSDISEGDLLTILDELNNDENIDGIITQLPLPRQINPNNILLKIDPKKDVDGFHPLNVGLLNSGGVPYFIPCTPKGIESILEDIIEDFTGLNAVIIGRSNIVGKPMAALLLQKNMTVTICHSKTKNLSDFTKKADVIIAASGATESFGREYFNENAIIIDVGINKNKEGKIAGDIKFNEVFGYVKAMTKVPGGVGPMTVASLMENTYVSFLRKIKT